MIILQNLSSITELTDELEKILKTSPETTRTILGQDVSATLVECGSVYFNFNFSDCGEWVKETKKTIFDNNIVEKMFNHILDASVSAGSFDYFITAHEFTQLPSMFSRYYENTGGRFKLNYKTISRVQKVFYSSLNGMVKRPTARNYFLPIWSDYDNEHLNSMTPSLIGFYLQLDRNGIFVISPIVRSCDIRFLPYDVWYFANLAIHAALYVGVNSRKIKMNYTIFNLHKYI